MRFAWIRLRLAALVVVALLALIVPSLTIDGSGARAQPAQIVQVPDDPITRWLALLQSLGIGLVSAAGVGWLVLRTVQNVNAGKRAVDGVIESQEAIRANLREILLENTRLRLENEEMIEALKHSHAKQAAMHAALTRLTARLERLEGRPDDSLGTFTQPPYVPTSARGNKR